MTPDRARAERVWVAVLLTIMAVLTAAIAQGFIR